MSRSKALGGTQGDLFPPMSDWRPTPVSELPSWRGARRIGLDTEFRDEMMSKRLGLGVRFPDCYLVGVSFAIEDGPKHYLPFRHEGGDNLPEQEVLRYLRDNCREFDGEIVGANLACDLDWLWEEGCEMPKVKRYRDVQVADPLIYELHPSYKLDDIAKRWGFEGKSETKLREWAAVARLDPKADLWRAPARFIGEYAADDALLPLQILAKQERRMENDALMDCWNMECRLLPVLVRMRRRGVCVDLDRLSKIEEWSKKAEAEALAVIKRETSVEIPVGEVMNVELLERAFKAAGIPLDYTSSATGLAKSSLAGYDHPVAEALARARKVNKIRTTFAASVRRYMVNGRIHSNFNQIRRTEESSRDGGHDETKGVAYGRLSSDHPNMQQQPGRDEETGPMWRAVYRPEAGELWAANDLKQQEPKWSFHFGAMMEKKGVKGVYGALKLVEAFNKDPSIDTYIPLVEMCGVSRGEAKIMWLARAYGNGDGSLCDRLGLPTRQVVYDRDVWKPIPVDTPRGRELLEAGSFPWRGAGEEGQKIIDKFDGEFPFLKKCAKLAQGRAEENGYVLLISGRRCHFEADTSKPGKWLWCHKAFNRVIQGSAAEQTKEITLAVSEGGFDENLKLQVHDELDFSVPDRETARKIADIMENAVPMLMPTIVDIELGASWGESMSIEMKVDGKKTKVPYEWRLG